MEIKISKLYGEDQIDLNNLNQIGGTFSQYVTEVSHVLIEQFEKRLLEKDKIILELKQHRKIKYEPYFIS